MKEVFKKILKSNAYNLDGVACCLAALAKREGTNDILKLCVNGIDEWNININYLAEYIDKEYSNYKNPVITNVVYDYVYRNIEVRFNYSFTRYYKNENASYYDDSRTSEQGDYIFKKTFTESSNLSVSYYDYTNFVNKYHFETINELKEEV